MMLWCNWLPLLLFVNEDCGLYSALVCVQISVASTVDSWNLDRVQHMIEYHTHTHTMWWYVEVCEPVVMVCVCVCVCVCGEGGEVRVNVNTVLCQFHVHTEVRLADCPTTVVSV